MSGLYALFLLLLWLGFLVWLCPRATARRVRPAFEDLATIGLFLVLLPLPVIDEIVGSWQMNRLCEANAKYRLGVPDPQGRVVRVSAPVLDEPVRSVLIPIRRTHVTYTDVKSGEAVVEFDRYTAQGGVFVRTFFGWSGSGALIVGRSYCSPETDRNEAAKSTFGFSVVN